jgi:hypothetical protein
MLRCDRPEIGKTWQMLRFMRENKSPAIEIKACQIYILAQLGYFAQKRTDELLLKHCPLEKLDRYT